MDELEFDKKIGLMIYLEQKGFKPNLWAYYDAELDLMKYKQGDNGEKVYQINFCNLKEFDIAGGEYRGDSGFPWFPLEQVLELLPMSIAEAGDRLEAEGMVNPEDDYHLRALELLRKEIQNKKALS